MACDDGVTSILAIAYYIRSYHFIKMVSIQIYNGERHQLVAHMVFDENGFKSVNYTSNK